MVSKSVLVSLRLSAVLTTFFLLPWVKVEARLPPSKCRLPDGIGICVLLDQCAPALAILRKEKVGPQPSVCGFDREESKAYVCCRVSALKCRDYKEAVKRIVDRFDPLPFISPLRPWRLSEEDQRQLITSRRKKAEKSCPGEPEVKALIINGVKALRDEFPHMVAVGRYEEGKGMNFPCGGTLISPRWVLTAAHCFIQDLNFVRVEDGVQNDFNVFDPSRDFYIAKHVIHEDYTSGGPNSKYHDVALVKLYENWQGSNIPVQFSTKVYPACLSQFPASSVTGVTEIVGWGRTTPGGEKSRDLMKASVPLLPDANCSALIRSNFVLRKGFPQGAGNGIICALDKEDGSDACQGDSGGPMCVRDYESCVFDVVGVVSRGVGCGSRRYPGIYADVFHHLSWIEEHVWPVDAVLREQS